ncbi:MAG: metalloregulator ArsR/SmtB family transcription factor [Proteobacteria bacterium]|nr:MAG: metalloregulator ArsR/SmtB family transcription factor [Pseudomonadota bacterium]
MPVGSKRIEIGLIVLSETYQHRRIYILKLLNIVCQSTDISDSLRAKITGDFNTMTANARQDDARTRATEALSTSLAALCKAASDPLRLDIMRVLSHDSFGVQELATIFSMPQPGMSHHLKILSTAGFLATRRQGNSIFYRRALLKSDSDFPEFQSSLFLSIDSLLLDEIYSQRILKIYADRSSQSRLYFEKNVEKFEENQGMLAELSQYLPNLKEMLDLTALKKSSRVMEVGPGQGDLLKELTRRFDQVVALDNSGEMLALTKGKVSSREKIEFVQSSLEDFDAKDRNFDAVVLNMVLHHMPSPQHSFQKIREILVKGGFLLIADLGSHNQEWARASCGDVWLGFDPQDLKEWAISSGFSEDQSLYLGLKNGFQIQLRLFRAI